MESFKSGKPVIGAPTLGIVPKEEEKKVDQSVKTEKDDAEQSKPDADHAEPEQAGEQPKSE